MNLTHCDWKYFYEMAKDERSIKELSIAVDIENRLKMKKSAALMLLEECRKED